MHIQSINSRVEIYYGNIMSAYSCLQVRVAIILPLCFLFADGSEKKTVNNDSGLGRRLEKIKTNHARRRRGFRKDTGCVGVVKRDFPAKVVPISLSPVAPHHRVR